jgi:hypothetical protein
VSIPIVAPYATTYAAHTPYLTLAEWLAAPTALDARSLIQGGTQPQQDQALRDAIERASSWIDGWCYQVLAATRDTVSGRYRVNRWGAVQVPLPRKPVLEVSAVSVGYRPSSMTPLTSLADVAIGMHGAVEIPVINPLIGSPSGTTLGARPIVQVTYVNGFPNTTLAVTVAAAATSITLSSVLGIYPGTALTVYDVTGGGTEQVTVASTYVAGSTTVPLTAPLLYGHAAGVSVSNLPPAVKEAAVLMTTVFIQTRGVDAIVLNDAGTPTASEFPRGTGANVNRAKELLIPFRRAR